MGVGLTVGAYFLTVVMSGLFIETENNGFKASLREYGYKLKGKKDDNIEFLKRHIVSLIPVFNVFFSSVLMYFSAKEGHFKQIQRLLDDGKLEKIDNNSSTDNKSDNNDTKVVEEKVNDNEHYNYAVERANNLHCKPKCLTKVKKNK